MAGQGGGQNSYGTAWRQGQDNKSSDKKLIRHMTIFGDNLQSDSESV